MNFINFRESEINDGKSTKKMTEITRNLIQMTVLIRKMMEKSVGKVSPKESFYNYFGS